MKSALITVLALAFSTQLTATEVVCSGKKHFSSPYPGASSSATIVLKANAENNEASLSVRGSTGGKTHKIELTRLDHLSQKDQIVIEGYDADDKKFKAVISYLTANGVSAKVHHTRETNLEYKCSHFTFKQ